MSQGHHIVLIIAFRLELIQIPYAALDMTSVGRINLVKIGKYALDNYTRIDCHRNHSTKHYSRSCKIELLNIQADLGIASLKKIGPDSLKFQYRSSSNNGEANNDTDERSGNSKAQDQPFSSFHQKTHRRNYERKRSSYQDQNSNQEASNKSTDLDPNDQMNHYQRLNIQPEADLPAIKSAYYSLSKRYHPDIVGIDDSEASENFRLITESYDILSDPKLRTQYDQSLYPDRNSLNVTSWNRAMHPNKDFNPLYRTRDADAVFRFRQEAALQREKMMNPNKFRAGAFKESPRDTDASSIMYELEKLDRRITDIKVRQRTAKTKNHDDFYNLHLANVIQRKQHDARVLRDINQNYDHGTSREMSRSDFMDILTGLSIVSLILLVIFNLYFDIDIGGFLDSKLDEALETDAKVQDANLTKDK